MKQYYKVFWFLFLVEAGFTPFLLMIFYIFKLKIIFLFKIPALLSFFIIFIFHFRRRIKWVFLNTLFALFGLWGLVWGMYEHWNTLDTKLFSSIYTFLMPIFSISFGVHFAKNYTYQLKGYVDKYMMRSFYLLVIVHLLYLFFHYVVPLIPYYGFGTKMDFVVAYLLGNKHLLKYLIAFFLIFASGKRATSLNVLLISIIFYSSLLVSKKLKNRLILFFSVLLFSGGMYYAYQNDYLRRFQTTLEFDITDDRAAYLATSGRWNEVVGVYEFMNEKPIRWLIGGGIGGKYENSDHIYGYLRKRTSHYSHVSPVGYTFLSGLPFAIVLYLYFFHMAFKGRKSNQNFYYLCFIVMIFGGIFGANLFIDHKIWVFVGITHVLINDKENKLPISYLG